MFTQAGVKLRVDTAGPMWMDADATRMAREVQPNVIICDIGLPDVDGYEVARTLRHDGALRDTRLVALSGYAQPEDRQRAREAGFDAHVPKPPDLDELLSVLTEGPSRTPEASDGE